MLALSLGLLQRCDSDSLGPYSDGSRAVDLYRHDGPNGRSQVKIQVWG